MNYSDYAKQYIGTKENSVKHRFIVDEYNKIIPLPRGYYVKYSDPWCATFVSFVLNKCNANVAPYECSCFFMWKKCVSNNQTINAKNATIDDLVFYDWNDDKVSDHVGIISSVNGNTLTVIEGNKSDAVGYRTIYRYNKQIYGFARVNQNIKNSVISNNSRDNIVNSVIRGDFGNGKERITKLTAAGYNYDEIQKLVNERLRKNV